MDVDELIFSEDRRRLQGGEEFVAVSTSLLSLNSIVDGIFRNATWRVWSRLLGPFICSGMIGFGLIRVGHDYHSELVKALGDAFVVAGIVGICLELFAANRIIEHAAEEVAETMTGRGLPSSARALIQKLVHETRIVYLDYRRSYRLEPHPTNRRLLIVAGSVSYTVVNHGKSKQLYSPKIMDGAEYNPVFQSLQFGNREYSPTTITKTVDKAIAIFYPGDDKVALYPSEPDKVVAKLEENQKCFVRWNYTLEMPEQYSDVVAFTGFTIHPVIELQDSPKHIEFWASEEDENECVHGAEMWTYNRAYVAGQHLRVWWRPRNDTY